MTYYQVLGVQKTATPAEIKVAYRRLAKQHHPDRNPGNAAAAEKFKTVAAANAVLSDPTQRSAYDATLAARGPGLPLSGVIDSAVGVIDSLDDRMGKGLETLEKVQALGKQGREVLQSFREVFGARGGK